MGARAPRRRARGRGDARPAARGGRDGQRPRRRCDVVALQTEGRRHRREHALADLRLGDLVAVRDWDATHYTGYRDGGVTVGVVASGDSPLAGNGPAVTVLLSAGDGSLAPRGRAGANLASDARARVTAWRARPRPGRALLETRGVSKHFAVGGGLVRALARRRRPELLRAVDDVSLRDRARRDARAGRRERLGEEHARAARAPARAADLRGHPLRRPERRSAARGAGDARAAEAHPGRLPGSLLVAQPDDDRAPDARARC